MKNLLLWLKGLVAAAIGGAANVVTAMIVDPKQYNLEDLTKVWPFCITGAILAAALYLKQSPLWPNGKQ